MKKILFSLLIAIVFIPVAHSQNITIGIMPFINGSASSAYPYANETDNAVIAIQDAVTDAFLETKRFSLVEREKMSQIKSEKELQKGEDFIDGSVIEQSKSLGAQYLVVGNVSKAIVENNSTFAPVVGTINSKVGEIAFNIQVVDVSTGLIMASNTFSGKGRGKNAMEKALDDIKPSIVAFIKENFKVTVPVASIEEKDSKGLALKILIAGGSSIGMKENNELKVYEASEMTVEGKKLTRKIPLGKVKIAKVEDENFSVCDIIEGNDEITKKIEAGAKVRCELINNEDKN